MERSLDQTIDAQHKKIWEFYRMIGATSYTHSGATLDDMIALGKSAGDLRVLRSAASIKMKLDN